VTTIDTRVVNDGTGTTVTLYQHGETYVVEAVNDRGTACVTLHDRADAARCYMHPFSRTDWLDYPGLTEDARGIGRPLSSTEYALAEQLEVVA